MQQQQDERPLNELFADLTRELTMLVREQVALARTELSGKAKALAGIGGMLAAGAALLYAGLLALLATAIIALALALPLWLSALIVSVAVLGAGGLLVYRARVALRRTDLVPRLTVETLREDAEWAKKELS